MERIIHPEMNNRYDTFIGPLDKWLPKKETDLEERLIELFNTLGIQSSVKQDKFSLPHQGEVNIKLHHESWVGGMWEFSRIARPILTKVLNEGCTKIRFYIVGQTYYGGEGIKGYLNSGIVWSFRYYFHN